MILSFILILIHAFWIYLVDPYPENDAILSFYYPFLNYLKATLYISNDFSFISSYTHTGIYPTGSASIAYLLSNLSLASFVLKYPYSISLVLIAMIGLTPHFSRHKNRVLFSLLLFTNPCTVICIRGLSAHSFIIFFSLVAFLTLRNYLAGKAKIINLLAFTAFTILSISFKHLGLIYFFCSFSTYILYAIFKKNFDRNVLLAMFFCFLGGISFYPKDSFSNYLFHWNQLFLDLQFLVLTRGSFFIFLIILTTIIIILPYKKQNRVPKFF
ncbi:hypothetical protein MJH12_01055, partial [bacterium]|nr:hypothetical protein [bacterium]